MLLAAAVVDLGEITRDALCAGCGQNYAQLCHDQEQVALAVHACVGLAGLEMIAHRIDTDDEFASRGFQYEIGF
jgi:hypothetical protein